MPTSPYQLRFFFDWGAGCLWAGDKATTDRFGYGPLESPPSPLPISDSLLTQCEALSRWHDTALNWEYPPDPGPWRQDECDRFNLAVRALLEELRRCLQPDFEILDQQPRMEEDPDLDAYLANPSGFRRS